MSAPDAYVIEYRDARGRWHRRRGRFDLASTAVDAARAYADGWRVIDAAGNEVDSSVRRLREARAYAARVARGELSTRTGASGAPKDGASQ